jgi:hypothetical protein
VRRLQTLSTPPSKLLHSHQRHTAPRVPQSRLRSTAGGHQADRSSRSLRSAHMFQRSRRAQALHLCRRAVPVPVNDSLDQRSQQHRISSSKSCRASLLERIIRWTVGTPPFAAHGGSAAGCASTPPVCCEQMSQPNSRSPCNVRKTTEPWAIMMNTSRRYYRSAYARMTHHRAADGVAAVCARAACVSYSAYILQGGTCMHNRHFYACCM